MEDMKQQAEAEFLRAKDRLARCLATTPDDRINWSPSPTCRTPIELVAHIATGIPWFTEILEGQPFPFKSIAEGDEAFRKSEKEFKTRDSVIGLLEQNSSQYVAWMRALSPEQLASTVTTPFGPIPMAVGITVMADQVRNHAAQLDYIQTIYGDHDWYIGM